MRVLVACEYSGIVRDAFVARGHQAVSCDLLKTDRPNWTYDFHTSVRVNDAQRGNHYKGDVREILDDRWDMMIAFPPCTHLSASGARWWKDKVVEQAEALDFVRLLLDAPIEKIALENPVGKISSAIRKPSQIIQPWQFGHGETKATCLWLKNLPKLFPSNIVEGREARIHKMSPSPDRWKLRSTTFQGIADAMAAQWG
jgi:hypothetical protein